MSPMEPHRLRQVPVLCCMARFPRPGTAKSRLAADLGEPVAHRLYVAMLRTSLERLARLQGLRRCWHVEGGSPADARGLLKQWDLAGAWTLRVQAPGDLGDRLREAARIHLEEAGAVVFLGADSPTLPLPYVNRAVQALQEVPFVLGPSADGGYWLLGMRRLEEKIFREIPWGSADVLEATLRRLAAREVVLLPMWYDLDEVSDLERLRGEAPGRFPLLEAALSDLSLPE